jgi:parallel beta-helix repeat protein
MRTLLAVIVVAQVWRSLMACAGDGRLELSQALMPCTLTNSGSYVVTEPLRGVAGSDGITVTASGVTLDLNGFALTGGTGSRTGCVVKAGCANVVIRNGIVRHWGQHGIEASAASNSMAQDIQATGNGGDGIRMGPASLVIGCAAQRNGGDGIRLGQAGVMASCLSRNNGRQGIWSEDHASLSSSTARDNQGHGIQAGRMVAIVETAARGNRADGIRADTGSLVADTVAGGNGSNGISLVGSGGKIQRSTAFGNGAVGFSLESYGMIEDCAARLNTNGGIRLTNGCYALNNTLDRNAGGPGLRMQGLNSRIENNHVLKNGIGIFISGSDNLAIRNTAFQNTPANYSITAGNHHELKANPGTNNASFDEPWASFDLF